MTDFNGFRDASNDLEVGTVVQLMGGSRVPGEIVLATVASFIRDRRIRAAEQLDDLDAIGVDQADGVRRWYK